MIILYVEMLKLTYVAIMPEHCKIRKNNREPEGGSISRENRIGYKNFGDFVGRLISNFRFWRKGI